MDIGQAQQDSLTRRLAAAAAAAASASTSSSPGAVSHHLPSASSPGLNLSGSHSAVVSALPSSLEDDHHSLSPAFAAAANILDLKDVISGNNGRCTTSFYYPFLMSTLFLFGCLNFTSLIDSSICVHFLVLLFSSECFFLYAPLMSARFDKSEKSRKSTVLLSTGSVAVRLGQEITACLQPSLHFTVIATLHVETMSMSCTVALYLDSAREWMSLVWWTSAIWALWREVRRLIALMTRLSCAPFLIESGSFLIDFHMQCSITLFGTKSYGYD